MQGKSHDEVIKLGEGLEMGAVHKAHTKMKVMNAKMDKGAQKMAQAAHERRENGGAHPDGDCQ